MLSDFDIIKILAKYDGLFQEGDEIIFTPFGLQRIRSQVDLLPDIINIPSYTTNFNEIKRLYLELHNKKMMPDEEIVSIYQYHKPWFELSIKEHAEALSHMILDYEKKE